MGRRTVRGCGVNRGSVRGAASCGGVNGCGMSAGSARSRRVGNAALRGCRPRRHRRSVRPGVMRRGAMRFHQMLLRLRFGMMQRTSAARPAPPPGTAPAEKNNQGTNQSCKRVTDSSSQYPLNFGLRAARPLTWRRTSCFHAPRFLKHRRRSHFFTGPAVSFKAGAPSIESGRHSRRVPL